MGQAAKLVGGPCLLGVGGAWGASGCGVGWGGLSPASEWEMLASAQGKLGLVTAVGRPASSELTTELPFTSLVNKARRPKLEALDLQGLWPSF